VIEKALLSADLLAFEMVNCLVVERVWKMGAGMDLAWEIEWGSSTEKLWIHSWVGK